MAVRRRYTRRTDKRGRAYIVDNATGKRAQHSAYELETLERAEERRRKQLAEKRRLAAVKGWQTRRENEYQRSERAAIENDGFVPVTIGDAPWRTKKERALAAEGLSAQAVDLWAGTRAKRAHALLDARDAALGPAQWLRGSRLEDRQVLRDMVDAADRRIAFFFAQAEALEFSPRDARTALFSPKARSPR